MITSRGLSDITQSNDQRTVSILAELYHCAPPDQTGDQVNPCVIGRVNEGLTERTTNAVISARSLFYDSAMGQPGKAEDLHCRRIADRLPRSNTEKMPNG